MYQASGQEAVGVEGGDIGVEVGFGQHVSIEGQVGSPAGAAEPSPVLADVGGAVGLALAFRPALAEQRLHGAADVRLEPFASLVEVLLVEQLIVPLSHRELSFGVDRAID